MKKQQFITKLNTILQHNKIPKPFEREKSGKINTKRIGKYGSTDRIFSKRSEEKLEKEYSIGILIDGSGSMFDSSNNKTRHKQAIELTEYLCDVFDAVPEIGYEVRLFGITDIILKHFNEPRDDIGRKHNSIIARDEDYKNSASLRVKTHYNSQTRDIIDIFAETEFNDKDYTNIYTGIFDEGNHDALALYRIYQSLKDKPGKKIIFVLSDGLPTYSFYCFTQRDLKSIRGDRSVVRNTKITELDSKECLKVTANFVNRQKDFDILSIGIMTDKIKDYYKYWAKVNNEEELYRESIRLLNKVIHK